MPGILQEADSDEAESDAHHGRYITFALDNEIFGIDIKHVNEIINMQKINALPDSPNYLKGIINLRGKIIPVIDMRLRLKKEAKQYTDRTCTIVVEIMGSAIGLIVDRVDEVLSIPDESVGLPPNSLADYQNRYIMGIGRSGEGIRLLIDCERLFVNEELQSFG